MFKDRTDDVMKFLICYADSMPGPRQSAPAAADDAEAALEEVERMRQERITSSQQASTSNQPVSCFVITHTALSKPCFKNR